MTALFIQKCGYYGPRLMKEFGLSVEDAAAILGNLGHESGGFVHLQELGKHHGSGGLGPGQWTGARRHAFEAWCRAHGVSTASDEGGCGYLIAELRGPESGAIAALKRSAGLESKVRAFERAFERAGVPAIARRVTWARLALSALHPGHPAAVAPASRPAARRKPISDKHRGHH